MACSLLSLIVQSQCDISKSSTGSNDRSVGFLIDSDTVKVTHVEDQMSIFSTKSVRTITVTSRLSSDPQLRLYTTRYCILNMLYR